MADGKLQQKYFPVDKEMEKMARLIIHYFLLAANLSSPIPWVLRSALYFAL